MRAKEDPFNILLSSGLIAFIGLALKYLAIKYHPNKRLRRSRRDIRKLVEESFAERPFKLPHGAMPGANLILIAKRAAPAT